MNDTCNLCKKNVEPFEGVSIVVHGECRTRINDLESQLADAQKHTCPECKGEGGGGMSGKTYTTIALREQIDILRMNLRASRRAQTLERENRCCAFCDELINDLDHQYKLALAERDEAIASYKHCGGERAALESQLADAQADAAKLREVARYAQALLDGGGDEAVHHLTKALESTHD